MIASSACPLTPPGCLISSADCPLALPPGSDRFFKLDLAFCYKNVCHYKSLFCTARCYTDTTLIMVAQHFEIITKAYETSQEQPPETKEVCP